MKKSRFNVFVIGALSIVLGVSSVPVFSAPGESGRDLPGYYEFFTKTGKVTRLKSEVKRDEEIKTGKITPIAVNEPLIDLELPDGFGHTHSTRRSVGKKNLVLITGRAWW
jgi:hypothetical protein